MLSERGWYVGPGRRRKRLQAFGWPQGKNCRPAGRAWVDVACVQKAEVTRDSLRGVLEAIGGEPCFSEDVTFDIVGNSLGVAFWPLGLAIVVEVIRPETLDSHMRSPRVVPAFEVGAQERQVVKTLDL